MSELRKEGLVDEDVEEEYQATLELLTYKNKAEINEIESRWNRFLSESAEEHKVSWMARRILWKESERDNSHLEGGDSDPTASAPFETETSAFMRSKGNRALLPPFLFEAVERKVAELRKEDEAASEACRLEAVGAVSKALAAAATAAAQLEAKLVRREQMESERLDAELGNVEMDGIYALREAERSSAHDRAARAAAIRAQTAERHAEVKATATAAAAVRRHEAVLMRAAITQRALLAVIAVYNGIRRYPSRYVSDLDTRVMADVDAFRKNHSLPHRQDVLGSLSELAISGMRAGLERAKELIAGLDKHLASAPTPPARKVVLRAESDTDDDDDDAGGDGGGDDDDDDAIQVAPGDPAFQSEPGAVGAVASPSPSGASRSKGGVLSELQRRALAAQQDGAALRAAAQTASRSRLADLQEQLTELAAQQDADDAAVDAATAALLDPSNSLSDGVKVRRLQAIEADAACRKQRRQAATLGVEASVAAAQRLSALEQERLAAAADVKVKAVEAIMIKGHAARTIEDAEKAAQYPHGPSGDDVAMGLWAELNEVRQRATRMADDMVGEVRQRWNAAARAATRLYVNGMSLHAATHDSLLKELEVLDDAAAATDQSSVAAVARSGIPRIIACDHTLHELLRAHVGDVQKEVAGVVPLCDAASIQLHERLGAMLDEEARVLAALAACSADAADAQLRDAIRRADESCVSRLQATAVACVDSLRGRAERLQRAAVDLRTSSTTAQPRRDGVLGMASRSTPAAVMAVNVMSLVDEERESTGSISTALAAVQHEVESAILDIDVLRGEHDAAFETAASRVQQGILAAERLRRERETEAVAARTSPTGGSPSWKARRAPDVEDVNDGEWMYNLAELEKEFQSRKRREHTPLKHDSKQPAAAAGGASLVPPPPDDNVTEQVRQIVSDAAAAGRLDDGDWIDAAERLEGVREGAQREREDVVRAQAMEATNDIMLDAKQLEDRVAQMLNAAPAHTRKALVAQKGAFIARINVAAKENSQRAKAAADELERLRREEESAAAEHAAQRKHLFEDRRERRAAGFETNDGEWMYNLEQLDKEYEEDRRRRLEKRQQQLEEMERAKATADSVVTHAADALLEEVKETTRGTTTNDASTPPATPFRAATFQQQHVDVNDGEWMYNLAELEKEFQSRRERRHAPELEPDAGSRPSTPPSGPAASSDLSLPASPAAQASVVATATADLTSVKRSHIVISMQRPSLDEGTLLDDLERMEGEREAAQRLHEDMLREQALRVASQVVEEARVVDERVLRLAKGAAVPAAKRGVLTQKAVYMAAVQAAAQQAEQATKAAADELERLRREEESAAAEHAAQRKHLFEDRRERRAAGFETNDGEWMYNLEQLDKEYEEDRRRRLEKRQQQLEEMERAKATADSVVTHAADALLEEVKFAHTGRPGGQDPRPSDAQPMWRRRSLPPAEVNDGEWMYNLAELERMFQAPRVREVSPETAQAAAAASALEDQAAQRKAQLMEEGEADEVVDQLAVVDAEREDALRRVEDAVVNSSLSSSGSMVKGVASALAAATRWRKRAAAATLAQFERTVVEAQLQSELRVETAQTELERLRREEEGATRTVAARRQQLASDRARDRQHGYETNDGEWMYNLEQLDKEYEEDRRRRLAKRQRLLEEIGKAKDEAETTVESAAKAAIARVQQPDVPSVSLPRPQPVRSVADFAGHTDTNDGEWMYNLAELEKEFQSNRNRRAAEAAASGDDVAGGSPLSSASKASLRGVDVDVDHDVPEAPDTTPSARREIVATAAAAGRLDNGEWLREVARLEDQREAALRSREERIVLRAEKSAACVDADAKAVEKKVSDLVKAAPSSSRAALMAKTAEFLVRMDAVARMVESAANEATGALDALREEEATATAAHAARRGAMLDDRRHIAGSGVEVNDGEWMYNLEQLDKEYEDDRRRRLEKRQRVIADVERARDEADAAASEVVGMFTDLRQSAATTGSAARPKPAFAAYDDGGDGEWMYNLGALEDEWKDRERERKRAAAQRTAMEDDLTDMEMVFHQLQGAEQTLDGILRVADDRDAAITSSTDAMALHIALQTHVEGLRHAVSTMSSNISDTFATNVLQSYVAAAERQLEVVLGLLDTEAAEMAAASASRVAIRAERDTRRARQESGGEPYEEGALIRRFRPVDAAFVNTCTWLRRRLAVEQQAFDDMIAHGHAQVTRLEAMLLAEAAQASFQQQMVGDADMMGAFFSLIRSYNEAMDGVMAAVPAAAPPSLDGDMEGLRGKADHNSLALREGSRGVPTVALLAQCADRDMRWWESIKGGYRSLAEESMAGAVGRLMAIDEADTRVLDTLQAMRETCDPSVHKDILRVIVRHQASLEETHPYSAHALDSLEHAIHDLDDASGDVLRLVQARRAVVGDLRDGAMRKEDGAAALEGLERYHTEAAAQRHGTRMADLASALQRTFIAAARRAAILAETVGTVCHAFATYPQRERQRQSEAWLAQLAICAETIRQYAARHTSDAEAVEARLSAAQGAAVELAEETGKVLSSVFITAHREFGTLMGVDAPEASRLQCLERFALVDRAMWLESANSDKEMRAVERRTASSLLGLDIALRDVIARQLATLEQLKPAAPTSRHEALAVRVARDFNRLAKRVMSSIDQRHQQINAFDEDDADVGLGIAATAASYHDEMVDVGHTSMPRSQILRVRACALGVGAPRVPLTTAEFSAQQPTEFGRLLLRSEALDGSDAAVLAARDAFEVRARAIIPPPDAVDTARMHPITHTMDQRRAPYFVMLDPTFAMWDPTAAVKRLLKPLLQWAARARARIAQDSANARRALALSIQTGIDELDKSMSMVPVVSAPPDEFVEGVVTDMRVVYDGAVESAEGACSTLDDVIARAAPLLAAVAEGDATTAVRSGISQLLEEIAAAEAALITTRDQWVSAAEVAHSVVTDKLQLRRIRGMGPDTYIETEALWLGDVAGVVDRWRGDVGGAVDQIGGVVAGLASTAAALRTGDREDASDRLRAGLMALAKAQARLANDAAGVRLAKAPRKLASRLETLLARGGGEVDVMVGEMDIDDALAAVQRAESVVQAKVAARAEALAAERQRVLAELRGLRELDTAAKERHDAERLALLEARAAGDPRAAATLDQLAYSYGHERQQRRQTGEALRRRLQEAEQRAMAANQLDESIVRHLRAKLLAQHEDTSRSMQELEDAANAAMESVYRGVDAVRSKAQQQDVLRSVADASKAVHGARQVRTVVDMDKLVVDAEYERLRGLLAVGDLTPKDPSDPTQVYAAHKASRTARNRLHAAESDLLALLEDTHRAEADFVAARCMGRERALRLEHEAAVDEFRSMAIVALSREAEVAHPQRSELLKAAIEEMSVRGGDVLRMAAFLARHNARSSSEQVDLAVAMHVDEDARFAAAMEHHAAHTHHLLDAAKYLWATEAAAVQVHIDNLRAVINEHPGGILPDGRVSDEMRAAAVSNISHLRALPGMLDVPVPPDASDTLQALLLERDAAQRGARSAVTGAADLLAARLRSVIDRAADRRLALSRERMEEEETALAEEFAVRLRVLFVPSADTAMGSAIVAVERAKALAARRALFVEWDARRGALRAAMSNEVTDISSERTYRLESAESFVAALRIYARARVPPRNYFRTDHAGRLLEQLGWGAPESLAVPPIPTPDPELLRLTAAPFAAASFFGGVRDCARRVVALQLVEAGWLAEEQRVDVERINNIFVRTSRATMLRLEGLLTGVGGNAAALALAAAQGADERDSASSSSGLDEGPVAARLDAAGAAMIASADSAAALTLPFRASSFAQRAGASADAPFPHGSDAPPLPYCPYVITTADVAPPTGAERRRRSVEAAPAGPQFGFGSPTGARGAQHEEGDVQRILRKTNREATMKRLRRRLRRATAVYDDRTRALEATHVEEWHVMQAEWRGQLNTLRDQVTMMLHDHLGPYAYAVPPPVITDDHLDSLPGIAAKAPAAHRGRAHLWLRRAHQGRMLEDSEVLRSAAEVVDCIRDEGAAVTALQKEYMAVSDAALGAAIAASDTLLQQGVRSDDADVAAVRPQVLTMQRTVDALRNAQWYEMQQRWQMRITMWERLVVFPMRLGRLVPDARPPLGTPAMFAAQTQELHEHALQIIDTVFPIMVAAIQEFPTGAPMPPPADAVRASIDSDAADTQQAALEAYSPFGSSLARMLVVDGAAAVDALVGRTPGRSVPLHGASEGVGDGILAPPPQRPSTVRRDAFVTVLPAAVGVWQPRAQLVAVAGGEASVSSIPSLPQRSLSGRGPAAARRIGGRAADAKVLVPSLQGHLAAFDPNPYVGDFPPPPRLSGPRAAAALVPEPATADPLMAFSFGATAADSDDSDDDDSDASRGADAADRESRNRPAGGPGGSATGTATRGGRDTDAQPPTVVLHAHAAAHYAYDGVPLTVAVDFVLQHAARVAGASVRPQEEQRRFTHGTSRPASRYTQREKDATVELRDALRGALDVVDAVARAAHEPSYALRDTALHILSVGAASSSTAMSALQSDGADVGADAPEDGTHTTGGEAARQGSVVPISVDGSMSFTNSPFGALSSFLHGSTTLHTRSLAPLGPQRVLGTDAGDGVWAADARVDVELLPRPLPMHVRDVLQCLVQSVQPLLLHPPSKETSQDAAMVDPTVLTSMHTKRAELLAQLHAVRARRLKAAEASAERSAEAQTRLSHAKRAAMVAAVDALRARGGEALASLAMARNRLDAVTARREYVERRVDAFEVAAKAAAAASNRDGPDRQTVARVDELIEVLHGPAAPQEDTAARMQDLMRHKAHLEARLVVAATRRERHVASINELVDAAAAAAADAATNADGFGETRVAPVAPVAVVGSPRRSHVRAPLAVALADGGVAAAPAGQPAGTTSLSPQRGPRRLVARSLLPSQPGR